MSDTWLLYLASFAVAFSISLLTTPMAKRLGIKFHAVDYRKSIPCQPSSAGAT